MTNPSLKEQLQALSLGRSPESRDQNKRQPKPKHQPREKEKAPAVKQAAKQKPAWLEQALYGVELLKANFPECFKEMKEIKPLKVGIKQDLVKHLSTREDIVIGDKACMVNSLSYYVNSPTYHKSVVEGATRIDLNGQAAGMVTAEEAKYSTDRRQAKLQKKQAAQNTKAV